MTVSTTDDAEDAEDLGDEASDEDHADGVVFSNRDTWLNLRDDESVVWAGKPHIYPVLHWILFPFLLCLVLVWAVRTYHLGGVYLGACAVVAAGAVLVAAWVYFKHASIKYIITDRGMYERRGVFTEVVTHIHLNRVQNTQYRRSAFGQFFDFGDVAVYTAGTSMRELKYECIRNPGEIDALIARQLDTNEFDEGD